jgi:shikimate dehydrogenase
LGGINVTIPYKEKILSLSVMEKGTVVECRAANTLVREQKGWSAHNTDGPGFLDDLKEHHISWKGKSVVLLGAGGAARGVLFSLGNHAGSISLINRSRDRALSLAEDFRARGGRAKVTVGAHIEESLSSADLLVNATSVGLKEGDPSPVPETCLRPELSVYDMIYHRETALVKASRDAGAIAVGGLGMLVNQGALSFELWFQEDLKKVKYDPRVLRQIMGDAARAALKGRNSQ